MSPSTAAAGQQPSDPGETEGAVSATQELREGGRRPRSPGQSEDPEGSTPRETHVNRERQQEDRDVQPH